MSFDRQENFHFTYLFLSSSHLSKLSLSTLDLISLNEVQMAEMPPGPRLVQSNYAKCNSRILLLKSLLKISTRSEQKQWDNFWAAWKFKRRDGIWNFERYRYWRCAHFMRNSTSADKCRSKRTLNSDWAWRACYIFDVFKCYFLEDMPTKYPKIFQINKKSTPKVLLLVTFALQLSGEHAGSVDVVCVVHLMIMVGWWWFSMRMVMIINDDGDDFKWWWWWF